MPKLEPLQPVSGQSSSRQFFVRSLAPGYTVRSSLSLNSPGLIRLEPALVTISCERIKKLLVHELAGSGGWQGKIFLSLYPTEKAGQPITIVSERLKNGWQYGIEMPALIERDRYVRAIVQTLLLEMANRAADMRSAEIPAWLTEGLTQQLLSANDIEIVLTAPTGNGALLSLMATNRSARRDTPVQQAHNKLEGQPPLSFDALSWPKQDLDGPEPSAQFQGSAQLFVHHLLQLEQGRACMRAMLLELPQYYNWQFAFFKSFHSCFNGPLAVEKWWALQTVHFSGRNPLSETWSFNESSEKFAHALHTTVEIHTRTNDLPLHSDVSLQTMIRDWDFSRQQPVLRSAIRELELMRTRLAPEFVGLSDRYRQVLQEYLLHPPKSSVVPFARLFGRNHSAEQTLNELDQMDAARAGLRPVAPPIMTKSE